MTCLRSSAAFLWECLQNSFEKLLVAFDVQVCELFVYNGCIHSCQLQKHRRRFNRIQPFLIKPSRTAEQRAERGGLERDRRLGAQRPIWLSCRSVFFPHTHWQDMSFISSAALSQERLCFHINSCPSLWFIAQRRAADLLMMFKPSMAGLQESERLSKHYSTSLSQ